MNYEHVLSFALDHPWAITRPMLSVICGVIAQRMSGEDVDRSVIDAALVDRKNLPQPRAGSIAIIPAYGVIAPRMNMMSEMSGGTTFEKLTAQLRETVANKTVKTVVFDVNSPGGNVAGATEFAREILRARTKKPIVAQIQYTGASAAYWPMACCTEVIAAPSAMVGSLGIYTAHDDLSAALEKLGIKRKYLSAGKGKLDGNVPTELSAEGEARIQAILDSAYDQMANDVVKGRGKGMTAARVRDDWKAVPYTSAEALANGMIDQIATLDETLSRILSASPDAEDQRAAELLLSPIEGTDQERPSLAATSQDRQADAALERKVFELQL